MLSLFSQFIFGNSSLFGDGSNNNPTNSPASAILSGWPTSSSSSAANFSNWKDKSLCFDLRQSNLEVNHGERLIACFFPIEDIKGNPGEMGLLKVTNLRLIWISCNKKRVNLSIGWRTVSLTFEQNLKDYFGAPCTNLCVLTKYESTKYEFVFAKMHNTTNNTISGDNDVSEFFSTINKENWDAIIHLKKMITKKMITVTHLTPMYLVEPFGVVFKVWHSYKQTHLFRHCRANLSLSLFVKKSSQIGQDLSAQQQLSQVDTMTIGEINKLPGEVILDTYPGILHIESKSAKSLGILTLTNVRLIWVDESLRLKNYSIPFIRIESVKLKQSDKIVINTLDYLATSNQIELRVQKVTPGNSDQIKLTKVIFEQLQNLHALFKEKPKFGPESCEDCINYISYLKPIEFYFNSIEDNLMLRDADRDYESKGQARNYLVDVDMRNQVVQVGSQDLTSVAKLSEEDGLIDQTEEQLKSCSAKLKSYLNEQPIDCDEQLIFSKGKLSKNKHLQFTYCEITC